MVTLGFYIFGADPHTHTHTHDHIIVGLSILSVVVMDDLDIHCVYLERQKSNIHCNVYSENLLIIIHIFYRIVCV